MTHIAMTHIDTDARTIALCRAAKANPASAAEFTGEDEIPAWSVVWDILRGDWYIADTLTPGARLRLRVDGEWSTHTIQDIDDATAILRGARCGRP